MRCIQYTVSREAVYQDVCRLLRVCLNFRDYKRCCSANLLTSLLMQASLRLVSLYQSCSMCVRTCCYETARKALFFNLPNLPALESRLNTALTVRLPASLKRRPQRLAVDLVLTPYHGQPQENPNEIYRGCYKSGTSHIHAYATLYVVRLGQRFTIALTSVTASEPLDQLVKRLIRRGKPNWHQIRLDFAGSGLLDGGCHSLFAAMRCPFLKPVIGRGRKAKDGQSPSGTNVFYSWKRSGFSSYVLHSRRGEKTARVSICVHRLTGMARKSGEKKTLVYAYWGLRPASTAWVREN